MTMYQYQKDHIFEPMLNEVLNSKNSKMKVLALSTGAGKTHTIAKHFIPYLLEKDHAQVVVFTTPNTASIGDVYDYLVSSVDSRLVDIEVYKDFCGSDTLVPFLNRKRIILCHPTYVSNNADAFQHLGEKYSLVGVSDEAHNGLQASNLDEARDALGYNVSYYPAEWTNTIIEIPYLAWFQVTATPRNTVDNSDYMELISEFFDNETLSMHQPRPRAVYLEDENVNDGSVIQDSSSEAFDKMFKFEVETINRLAKKYGFPDTKPVAIFSGGQIGQPGSAENVYNKLSKTSDTGTVAVSLSGKKKLNGVTRRDLEQMLGRTPNSSGMIGLTNDKETPVNCFVANNIIGTAVNIPNATYLHSTKRHQTVKDSSCSQSVEQLLGRMLRWPEVEGLKNWDDVLDFEAEQIANGVPEEDIALWIDLVFGYVIRLPYSIINKAGFDKFFGHHTYTFEEWNTVLERKRIEARNKFKSSKGKRSNNVIKTPFAQAGTLEYRDKKGDLCEVCPKIDGVPTCKHTSESLGFTTKEYIESLDVHHTDGDHLSNNTVTACANVHRMVTSREGHAKNLKYRT